MRRDWQQKQNHRFSVQAYTSRSSQATAVACLFLPPAPGLLAILFLPRATGAGFVSSSPPFDSSTTLLAGCLEFAWARLAFLDELGCVSPARAELAAVSLAFWRLSFLRFLLLRRETRRSSSAVLVSSSNFLRARRPRRFFAVFAPASAPALLLLLLLLDMPMLLGGLENPMTSFSSSPSESLSSSSRASSDSSTSSSSPSSSDSYTSSSSSFSASVVSAIKSF
mmetsp:Transcript_7823/g.22218  ORF Transcript_7823/g.22218 Transcript_7823/m.22218 type:complete len:224 (+) Transcript_7823:1006-1677(+)